MRESAKDVSALVNPMLFRRQDGREFEFRTVSRDDRFFTQVVDVQHNVPLDGYDRSFRTTQGVKDYIDSVLLSRELAKIK